MIHFSSVDDSCLCSINSIILLPLSLCSFSVFEMSESSLFIVVIVLSRFCTYSCSCSLIQTQSAVLPVRPDLHFESLSYLIISTKCASSSSDFVGPKFIRPKYETGFAHVTGVRNWLGQVVPLLKARSAPPTHDLPLKLPHVSQVILQQLANLLDMQAGWVCDGGETVNVCIHEQSLKGVQVQGEWSWGGSWGSRQSHTPFS